MSCKPSQALTWSTICLRVIRPSLVVGEALMHSWPTGALPVLVVVAPITDLLLVVLEAFAIKKDAEAHLTQTRVASPGRCADEERDDEQRDQNDAERAEPHSPI